MIDGKYKFEVDVPFGRKEGTIVLRAEGNTAFADHDAPVSGKKPMEGQGDGDTLTAQRAGKIKFLGNVEFTAVGTVSGDNLHVDIKSNKGDFIIDGVRV